MPAAKRREPHGSPRDRYGGPCTALHGVCRPLPAPRRRAHGARQGQLEAVSETKVRPPLLVAAIVQVLSPAGMALGPVAV